MAKKVVDTTEKSIEQKLIELKKLQDTYSAIDRIKTLRGELPLEVQDLEVKRAELDQIKSETKAEEEGYRLKVQELEEVVEERLLRAFHRIREGARNGLAVVSVDRDACGGCFNKIPPQRQLDIKLHKKVLVCEYCGRIMVDPEIGQEVSE